MSLTTPIADVTHPIFEEIGSRKPKDEIDRVVRLEFLSRWFIEMEHYSEAISLLADAVKRQSQRAA